MAREDSPIEKLSSVLEKSLKRMELSARLEEYAVWPVWNEIVGATIARNAQPEKIRHGTLFVKVSSPVWMQQLQYMKEMIAEKLNARLGKEVVRNIFFVVGTLEPEPASAPAKAAEAAEREAPSAGPLEGDAVVEEVENTEVRRALKRLLDATARKGKR